MSSPLYIAPRLRAQAIEAERLRNDPVAAAFDKRADEPRSIRNLLVRELYRTDNPNGFAETAAATRYIRHLAETAMGTASAAGRTDPTSVHHAAELHYGYEGSRRHEGLSEQLAADARSLRERLGRKERRQFMRTVYGEAELRKTLGSYGLAMMPAADTGWSSFGAQYDPQVHLLPFPAREASLGGPDTQEAPTVETVSLGFDQILPSQLAVEATAMHAIRGIITAQFPSFGQPE